MPTLLTKLEYVSQSYHAFPANDIRNGGKFSGVTITGTVAFQLRTGRAGLVRGSRRSAYRHPDAT